MRECTNGLSPSEPPVSSVLPDRLKRALALALELESALVPVGGKQGERIDFRLRLARAQALGIVDILTHL